MPETVESSRDEEFEHAVDLLVDHLDAHINRGILVLKSKAEPSTGSNDHDKYRCAALMLLNAGISLQSIKKYYKPINLQTKDVVVLYRVIYEGIVNCLYVLSSDVGLARRALRHARQKTYRHHGSVQELGPYKVSLSVDPFPKEMKALVKEFTSKTGKGLNWTQHSVPQRIRIIADKYGDRIWFTLGQSYIGYYGHASEFVHSSLFSALEIIGKRDEREFFEDMKTTLWTCLVEIGCGVLALLDVLEVETGIQEFRTASKTTSDILLGVCEVAGQDGTKHAN